MAIKLWREPLAAIAAAALLLLTARIGGADSLTPLEVAYAGSMGSMMDGGVRAAIAKALGAELRGRAQGSTGLANLIVAGSIRPDVFVAVTPEPMRIVLAAGKATRADPIARTEMVIAYSAQSKYAAALGKAAGAGAPPWWMILQRPGFRFGRTDPNTDPLGLNAIFMMRLASIYYGQADLEENILGAPINPRQIFQEPELMARLQAGQLDAAAAYKTQPATLGLPFIELPAEINLGHATMMEEYRRASVTLNRKVRRPSPLVFYAAVLNDAPHPALAKRFVGWLNSGQAKRILAQYRYDTPGDAVPLMP